MPIIDMDKKSIDDFTGEQVLRILDHETDIFGKFELLLLLQARQQLTEYGLELCYGYTPEQFTKIVMDAYEYTLSSINSFYDISLFLECDDLNVGKETFRLELDIVSQSIMEEMKDNYRDEDNQSLNDLKFRFGDSYHTFIRSTRYNDPDLKAGDLHIRLMRRNTKQNRFDILEHSHIELKSYDDIIDLDIVPEHILPYPLRYCDGAISGTAGFMMSGEQDLIRKMAQDQGSVGIISTTGLSNPGEKLVRRFGFRKKNSFLLQNQTTHDFQYTGEISGTNRKYKLITSLHN
jgi:hypothetical protein